MSSLVDQFLEENDDFDGGEPTPQQQPPNPKAAVMKPQGNPSQALQK